tara:strand:- start:134 stop:499 length:366 start_codon:yes stop_codon:yes gene_type:complete
MVIIIFKGCSHQVAQLSLVSTTITEINEETLHRGTFKGKDQHYIIFLLPTGTPKIDNAIDNTLKDNDLDYLTNVKINREQFYLPYIGGYTNYTVYGEGWEIINPTKKPIRFDPLTGKPAYD